MFPHGTDSIPATPEQPGPPRHAELHSHVRARARSVTPSLGRPAKLQTYWYTTPEVAIISCGNGNPHGHPNADALARLNTSGVQRIYQTQAGETAGAVSDEIRAKQAVAQDHVVIRSDGASYRVLTERVFASDG